jgi:predicted regulator of Ras-like GTPase activity (Roadblock/LC7/MglB family)
MDGFQLLARMSRSHRTVPVMVMTAYGTPETERQIHELGSFQYLEKPVDFDELGQKILATLEAGPRSLIQGITLPALMQLVELEQKTCTLTVRSGERTVWLYFTDGALVDAESDTSRGPEVVYEAVGWEEAEIEVDSFCPERNRVIEQPLNMILLEAHRILDEQRRKRAEEAEARRQATERSEEMVNGARSSTDVLEDFLKVPGVSSAVVVGRDGFVIESSGGGAHVDVEDLGAALAHAVNGIEEMGSELAVSSFQDLFVEYGRAVIMCKPVGEAVIGLVAPDASKLGIIRHKTKPLVEELGQFF